MTTSPHLTGKLRGALGNDAGDELVGIVDKAAGDISELRADVAELRHEMQVGFTRIEQAMLSMKSELKLEISEQVSGLSNGLTREISDNRTELTREIADNRTELAREMAAMRTELTREIGKVRSDLMKWSFMFWVGAVGAIALLARVLDR